MNKKKSTLYMLAACALLSAYTLPATADGGPYIAADFGRSHFSGGDFDFVPFRGTVSVKDTASAYRFTFGYQFTPYWGMELGYVDLGEGTETYVGINRIRVTGFYVAGTGTWPITEQWSLFARGGTITSTVKHDFDCSNISCPLVGDWRKSGTDATYGVGAKWDVWSNLSLRLGWDNYRHLGDTDYKANLVSLGVEWRFF